MKEAENHNHRLAPALHCFDTLFSTIFGSVKSPSYAMRTLILAGILVPLRVYLFIPFWTNLFQYEIKRDKIP